jgi:HNH endonuclease
MDAPLARAVRERAGDACEYCRVPQAGFPAITFHVDHVVAVQHRGRMVLGNLALACVNCNNHKGPNIAGLDPRTGRLTRLFNPRRQRWGRHFRWDGARIVGRTAVGRVTVDVLNLNHGPMVELRAVLIEEGLLVPADG